MTGDDAREGAPEPAEFGLRDRLRAGYLRFDERNRSVEAALERAWHHSRLGRATGRLVSIVESARVYRWLAADPDQREIVVDLRESYAFRPVITLLEAFGRAALQSRTVRLGRRTVATAGAHTVPLLGTVLLAVALGTAIRTWQGTSPLWLAALALVGLAGALGLAVDRSAAALETSRAYASLAAVFRPPAPPAE